MSGAAAALALVAAAAGPAGSWRLYDARLDAACPSRHVEWMCDDCRVELVAAFEATLPASQARRIAASANIRRACAAETIGHSCAFARSLVAYRRLGLLDRFVGFGCRTVTCEEGAVCSRFPGQRP